MKLAARWALPFYPDFLMTKVMEKCVKRSYKKDRAPIESNSWIVKSYYISKQQFKRFINIKYLD